MDKETLEDAAKNKYPIENTGDMFMPNRHDVNEIYRQEGFIEGAKWQAERMYSEEDFKEFARNYYRDIKLDKSNLLWEVLADKCFEQFKKK